MSESSQDLVPPRNLTATAAYRTDGEVLLHGIQLEWTVGENEGGEWPPPADWHDGDNPPYPHEYEVWIDGGAVKQTAGIYWPSWAGGWQWARAHWLCLGTDPVPEYRVKIRAKLSDGAWSDFTNEVVVATKKAQPYADVAPRAELAGQSGGSPVPRHGSVGYPESRAVRAIRDNDPAEICQRARELNTSTTWQEVVPPEQRMVADPPWNGTYLEYRKFFQGPDVASASNPAFAGLDLVGDWPTTALDASAPELTFAYAYTAHHVDHTWTHQWFVTRDDWDPDLGVSWETLEPVPFMTETHGDTRVNTYVTSALSGRKSGRHAIVDVWGGHGGPMGEGGRLAGEFFVSVCDVTFE